MTFTADRSSDAGRAVLRAALIIGLVARLAILWNTGSLGLHITDEQSYSGIADNLVAGYGYANAPGELTSIRPPLYPALVAGLRMLTGRASLQLIRALQIALALVTAWLVFLIGNRVYGPVVGRYAAAICWLYPSLMFFNFLILTETLFTFLLVAFVLLTVMLVQQANARIAFLCGATLALGALTRSVLWPLPLALCPLLLVLIDAPFSRRVVCSALLLAGYVVVIGPWAVRNTRLQHTFTVVDTMGGMNLRMGNYEYTPDDRMWDAVALKGERSWVYGLGAEHPGDVTEGEKEKWAQGKAIAYIESHPMTTLRRGFIKFADLWGLEREFMAGVQTGMYHPPVWFQIVASVCIVLGYVFVVTVGAVGMWLAAPKDWRVLIVLLLPVALTAAVHSLVFGHSRYHLPLMPIFGLFGAAWLSELAPSLRLAPRATMVGAMASVTALLTIWVRQVALVDLPRISSLLHHVG